MYFIFPPHLTYASALPPGETENPKIAPFRLNPACFFTKNTRNTLKHHLVTAKPPFTAKTIDWIGCTRRDLGYCCLLPTCSMLTKSVTVSVAV